ncbi:hypothetical protein [Undibacterium sp.]|uniref:hypothetical protein n=1 Tax=Undibacterium sp. TaxID=1914977 RepID=UPI003752D9E5
MKKLLKIGLIVFGALLALPVLIALQTKITPAQFELTWEQHFASRELAEKNSDLPPEMAQQLKHLDNHRLSSSLIQQDQQTKRIFRLSFEGGLEEKVSKQLVSKAIVLAHGAPIEASYRDRGYLVDVLGVFYFRTGEKKTTFRLNQKNLASVKT